MKKIVVNAASQEAVLYDGDSAIRLYVVSTAKNGLGCGDNSLCTPNGKLRIAEKIGDGLPIGTILRGGEPTKKVWSSDPSNPLSTSQDDFVLSRILRLRGCELGNANTLKRCIYIHGTNHENLLGQPASHGCIRMSNTDGIELFDLVEVGDEVDVTAGHEEVAETQVWEAPLIGPRFQGRAALTLRPLMAQSRHTQCADECPL